MDYSVLEKKLNAADSSGDESETELAVTNPISENDLKKGEAIAADEIEKKKMMYDVRTYNSGLEIGERIVFNTEVKTYEPSDSFCMEFSRDNKLLAVGCSDGHVRIFNSQYKQAYFLRVPSNGGLPTTCVSFRPYAAQAKSNNVLLVANSDGTASSWHIQSQTRIFSIHEPNNQIFSVDYSPDGVSFVTAGREPIVRIYDENTKSLSCELKSGVATDVPGHSSRIYCVKYSPDDSNVLLSGGWDNTVQVWDVRCGGSVRSIYGPHICGASLSIHKSGRTLLTGSYKPDNPVQLWDISTGKLMNSLGWKAYKESPQMIYAATFSPDGTHFAAGGVGSGYSEARVYETSSLEHKNSISLGEHPIYALAYDQAGGRLVAGGGGSSLCAATIL